MLSTLMHNLERTSIMQITEKFREAEEEYKFEEDFFETIKMFKLITLIRFSSPFYEKKGTMKKKNSCNSSCFITIWNSCLIVFQFTDFFLVTLCFGTKATKYCEFAVRTRLKRFFWIFERWAQVQNHFTIFPQENWTRFSLDEAPIWNSYGKKAFCKRDAEQVMS